MRDEVGLPVPSGTSVTIRLAGVRSLSAAVAILACAAVGGLAAQSDSLGSAPSRKSDSTAVRVWPPSPSALPQCAVAGGTTHQSVYLRASIADSDRSALTAQTDLMAQQLAESMRASMGASPDSLADGDKTVGVGSVPTVLIVIARPDGSVQRRASSMTGDTTAAAILLRAFDTARANGDALLVWPDGYGADSIIVRLELLSLPVKHEGSLMVQYGAHPAFGVFRLSVLTFVPALAKPNNPDPVYPFVDQLHRVGGTLMLQFVVDTNGRAEPETMHDVWPPNRPKLTGDLLRYYERFVEASERAVATWKFSPAHMGSCLVKQIVQMPIRYKFGNQ